MKNRLRKTAAVLGMACTMSLAVYGCGEAKAPEAEQVESAGDSEAALNGESVGNGEAALNREGAGNVESAGNGEADGDSVEKSPGLQELAGDIQEIGEGTFIVNEIYQETMGDGSEVMVVGAPGNEEDMNLITVLYDADTVFTGKKIWNGGADYEDFEASADDMATGMTAEMEGTYEGDVFHASRIQLVEVVL